MPTMTNAATSISVWPWCTLGINPGVGHRPAP
jgi:hypothetical protein